MRRSTPKKRHATLADIAASAGVTPMTVSRVVNGNGYVSAETREKVLHAVSALNYRRNGLARGLKRQRTDTIGLVLGDIANPFAAELARAVREVMSAKGYNVFICVSEHSAREDIAAFESLADHRVDGVIVATPSGSTAWLLRNTPPGRSIAAMFATAVPGLGSMVGRELGRLPGIVVRAYGKFFDVRLRRRGGSCWRRCA